MRAPACLEPSLEYEIRAYPSGNNAKKDSKPELIRLGKHEYRTRLGGCRAHCSHPDNPYSTNAPGEYHWAIILDPEDDEFLTFH